MEGHCSTGKSPQWAVVPKEEKEEEEECVRTLGRVCWTCVGNGKSV